MEKIRLFVIAENLMFGQGLKSLLSQDPRFEIVGEARTVVQATQPIRALLPDVIILGNSSKPAEAANDEIRLLEIEPQARLISLSLQNNLLFIYHATHKMINNVKDLIDALASDPASSGQADPSPHSSLPTAEQSHPES